MSVRTAFAVYCDAADCQDMHFTLSVPSEAVLSDLGYEMRDGQLLCSFCQDRALCDACRSPLTAGRCTWRACDLFGRKSA